MKSLVVERSIVIGSRKTSVSLEDAFWQGLRGIAANRRVALRDLVGSIGTERQQGNLSSAIRLFVLDYYQKSAALPNRSFMAADHHHAAH
jgi:predicted DNA-binding ribbon-helix-helix protein